MDTWKGKHFLFKRSGRLNNDDIFLSGYGFHLILSKEFLFKYHNRYLTGIDSVMENLNGY